VHADEILIAFLKLESACARLGLAPVNHWSSQRRCSLRSSMRRVAAIMDWRSRNRRPSWLLVPPTPAQSLKLSLSI